MEFLFAKMKIVIVVLGPSWVNVQLTLVICFQIAKSLVEIVKQVMGQKKVPILFTVFSIMPKISPVTDTFFTL